MTLALGTALQNGTYVIDALSGEDSVGPLYLATHVPSGQWVMVRVLGSRHPESLPDVSQRAAFYQYLDSLNQLGQPFIPKRIKGFEEDRVCYQTFSQPQGVPLSQGVHPQMPLSLAASLTLVRQLAQDLQTLRPSGWAGLRLAPDQVWQADPGGRLTLTGFDFPGNDRLNSPLSERNQDEALVVQGLTELLYFLLTGQWATRTQAPLGVDLRQRRPDLPASLDGIFQAAHPPLAKPLSLEQWLAQLPHVASLPKADQSSIAPSQRAAAQRNNSPSYSPQKTAATVLAAPVAPAAAANRVTRTTTTPAKTSQHGLGKLPWALLATGFVFGLGGVSFGLQARLQPTSPAAQTRFNPNQAFPPLPDWDSPSFDDPTVGNRRSQNRPQSAAEEPRPVQPSRMPAQTMPTAAPAPRDPVPAMAPRPIPTSVNEAPSKADDGFPSYDGEPDPLDSPTLAPEPIDVTPDPRGPPPPPPAVPPPAAPVTPAPVAPAPIAPAPVVPAPVAPAPVAPPPSAPPAPLTSS